MTLPAFENLVGRTVTEERLERMVQSYYDRADYRYMSGEATTEEYNRWTDALNRWEQDQRDAGRVQS